MYLSAPIIKKIDQAIRMINILEKSMNERLIENKGMGNVEVAEILNGLATLRADWQTIRADLIKLGDPIV